MSFYTLSWPAAGSLTDTLELLPLKVFLVALSALSMSHGLPRKRQPNTCTFPSHLSIESFMTLVPTHLRCQSSQTNVKPVPLSFVPVSPGFVDSLSSKLLFITFSKDPVVSL